MFYDIREFESHSFRQEKTENRCKSSTYGFFYFSTTALYAWLYVP